MHKINNDHFLRENNQQPEDPLLNTCHVQGNGLELLANWHNITTIGLNMNVAALLCNAILITIVAIRRLTIAVVC